MPDTPIDLSEGIQSVRMKVPTAEVPIPPEGFAQLHSPAPGELALRLPDGSVVTVGGGGAPQTSLHNPYGSQVNLDGTDPTIGVLFGIAPGQQWVIDPPVFPVDIYRRPLGVLVDTVPISSAELLALHTTKKVLVAAPGAGRWLDPVSLSFVSIGGGYSSGGGVLAFGWDFLPPTGASFGSQTAADLGLEGSGTILSGFGVNTGTGWDAADLVNKPLTIASDLPLTGGVGILLVTVTYRVLKSVE